MAFQPHGLIIYPELERTYRNAHFNNYKPGLHDAKETETIQLMEDLFNKVLFVGLGFAVNSQQPPIAPASKSAESLKRCDIVIKYYERSDYTPKILCFVECKRTKIRTRFQLQKLQEQALKYCKLYLEDEENQHFISAYACTAAGAHLRLWKFTRGDGKLIGFWDDSND